jgi:imidazolonepropionase-like amidohydrolase
VLLACGPLLAQEQLSMKIHYGNRPRDEAGCKVAKWGPRGLPSPALAFHAAKVVTCEGEPIDDGVVLCKDGLIQAVGKWGKVQIPPEYEVRDVGENWLVPGIVDLHCHIAEAGPDIRDLNDTVHATNPEFRTFDLITLTHPLIKNTLAGGVTTVLFIPGSGSNMGGFGTLTKTAGDPRDALVRFPGSLKIAQAGNPERQSGDLGMTRMGMNQGLRFTLERGRKYYQEWEDFDAGRGPKPKLRPDLEYLRGLFRHEYPVSVHTQIYQVVLETFRQLRLEFGLWVFVDHGEFDAYRMSGFAADIGVPIVAGPRSYHFDRATSKFIGLMEAWYGRGTKGWREEVGGVGRDGIAVNTDSPVVPGEQITLQCAIGVRLGLPDEVGIRALTINPARIAGIDHRVGSLKAGKDADFGVWTGDPIDPRHHTETMVVSGRIAYVRDPKRPRW